MNLTTLCRTGLLAVCIVLPILSGCSAFDHDWEAAAGATPANPLDLTGRWQGTWQSDGPHSGDLRCLITPIDKATIHARFAATYWNILHFGYEMDLKAERQGDWIHFDGDADLGPAAGGVYHYDGHANAEKFYALYRSTADHGRFTMKRPVEEKPLAAR